MKKGYFHQKLEALNKGLNGDWQKEGHSFSHFFENDSQPGFKVLQIESHKDGNRSGFWRFSYIPHQKDDKRSKYTNHTVDDAYTYPEHQRKGLATHAYNLSEKILGSKADSMEGARSEEADGLWSQPNRTFGKSEDEKPKTINLPWNSILASHKSVEKAHMANITGRGSKSSGNIQVHKLEDGRHLLVDGYHRFAHGIASGQKEFPVDIVSEGYSDYWATPTEQDTFKGWGKPASKSKQIKKGENMDAPKPVVTPVEETPSQKYFKDKIKQIKDKFNAEQETKAGETWKNNIKAAGVDAKAKMSKSEPPKEPPTLNYATMENSSYKPWHWKEKLAASKRLPAKPTEPTVAPAAPAAPEKPRSFRDYANGIKGRSIRKEEMTNKLKGGKADGKDIKDFDPKALKEGAEHEREHTKDKAAAKEIAADHLSEDKAYYKKLKRLT